MAHLKTEVRNFNNSSRTWLKRSLFMSAGFSAMVMAPSALAQSAPADEVIVTGIRASLENALVEKRNATTIKEVILAEDIGKLPDQNLSEVLENLHGIQITREAGVGTGVQIRGTNDNRTEINGVTTVGSGSGRGGISFEDVPAAMIAGVEVIKAPDAKTIEGAIGGTINLRTIRPLDLKETLASFRIQGEHSSLSTDGIQPRLSGVLGKKWKLSAKEIGTPIRRQKLNC
jgi:iron complex outermembrane receptor protein